MIHKRFEELKLSMGLPSPPGAGFAILRSTQREDASMEELLWCLQGDPALTGRLLKLANGSLRSSEAPCTSVLAAAQRIGMRQVRNVALGFTLVTSNRSGVCAPFGYERYWSSAIRTAVVAQELARRTNACDPAEAFTLGLVSRVGMLALASIHPDAFAKILAESADGAENALCAAEAREFGIDHWEVTCELLQDWGLPETHAQAIAVVARRVDRDGPSDVEVESRARLLELALRVASTLERDRVGDGARFERDWTAATALASKSGLEQGELRRACERAVRHCKEWCEFLRLPVDVARSFEPAIDAERAFPPLPEVPEEPSLPATASAESARPLERPQIRVLVVDDDEKLAKLVAHHLRRAGYLVDSVGDALQALSVATSQPLHIVVTDWMMPGMSGLDLCRALRTNESTRKTYVLILTAREDEDRIVDAFNAGADDYVTKPFNPRILVARVQAAQRLVELQLQVESDKRLRESQVAEMGLLTRKLRAAALTDVLTELPNRRHAMTQLQQEWESSVHMKRPLSVVMIDIDHFKRINDQHGHDVGDQVLKSTANVLRAHTRRGDVVFRLGGEEFLVINVDSTAEEALVCAERLRAAVEANVIAYEGFDGRVTVSLGVAERGPTIQDVDRLLKAADQAVYAAKAAGRNCIRLPGPTNTLRSA